MKKHRTVSINIVETFHPPPRSQKHLQPNHARVFNMSKHVNQLVWVGALGLLMFWYYIALISCRMFQSHTTNQKRAFSTGHTNIT